MDSTRPDLAVTVCNFAGAMVHPTNRHCLTVQQVARYHIGTTNYGLHFQNGRAELQAQADAAFAQSYSKRRSVYGYLIYYCQNLIS